MQVITNQITCGLRNGEPSQQRAFRRGAFGRLLLAILAIGCGGCSLLFAVPEGARQEPSGHGNHQGGATVNDGLGAEPIGGGGGEGSGEGRNVGGGSPLPAPSLCGNGTLDGGERCDDGNGNSNDGCSSNCVLEGDPDDCDTGGAVLLLGPLGLSVRGSTAGAANNTGASCQYSSAGTHHYDIAVVAPTGGTAVFSIEADYDAAFTLLSECSFPFPMNNCRSDLRSVDIEPGSTALSVLVTGLKSSEGAYTLRVHLDP